jgi:hypothetical protein
MKEMEGMDHGKTEMKGSGGSPTEKAPQKMKDMEGMEHEGMKGMDHEGMGHGTMEDK